eukprot:TRINITY_DN4001_c0_g1_i1.p1 TRINITY_DN4001_c0_g1~~TRINITY_DN4001_c0_g1_i1.p1  ORF type:complete len:434 (+),score=100.22 TRINITY_DN4001_c0_g1_i1:70-1371(+)
MPPKKSATTDGDAPAKRATSSTTKKSTVSKAKGSASGSTPFVGSGITDPDVVLRIVRSLADQEKSSLSSRPVITLSSLNLPDIKKEVKEMQDDEVLTEIEMMTLATCQTILQGRGYAYEVPSRTASNQLYVPEVDRIVLKNKMTHRPFASLSTAKKTAITTRLLQLIHELCTKGIHCTKRDIFYADVKLFGDQSESDVILEDMACMVGCTRTSLNVVASGKGVVLGKLIFEEDGDLIDCTKMGVGGKIIPPFMDRVKIIDGSKADFILLIEKDAAFSRLAEDRFYNKYPCIMVTAKGQPDVATRLFLKKLKDTLHIPILGLVDSDPYGLKILSVYMSGSKNMSYDSANLTTSDVKWLGVLPSDLDKYNIPDQCRLEMTKEDIETGKRLLEEEFVKKNPRWHSVRNQTLLKVHLFALTKHPLHRIPQPFINTRS